MKNPDDRVYRKIYIESDQATHMANRWTELSAGQFRPRERSRVLIGFYIYIMWDNREHYNAAHVIMALEFEKLNEECRIYPA